VVNRHLPHVLVLPEDDANRQIANGFLLEPRLQARKIQILPTAGGWPRVLADLKSQHIELLRRYPDRHLVLIIDFDGNVADRRQIFMADVPAELRDRVFLIGTRDEPEALKRLCEMSFECIGTKLASECGDGAYDGLWKHDDLVHNASELQRLIATVRPILFQ
jgi:hypothetical protein